jgi:hypothetical protein
MSAEDSRHSGATRRGFGVILGGLAAGAVLGTTVVAHADDDEQSVRNNTGVDSSRKRERPARSQAVTHRDVAGLAAKLDALDLSANERALLVGLLSVATDAIARSGRDQSASPLVSTVSGPGPLVEVRTPRSMPSIRDQFRAAFTPGEVPPPEAADLAKNHQLP